MSASKQGAAKAAAQPAHAAGSASASPLSATLAQQLGNQHLHRLLSARMLQAKLTVSAPHDAFELEADRVADHVMRMPESAPLVGGQRAPQVQRLSDAGGQAGSSHSDASVPTVDASMESSIHSLSGRGRALPDSVRSFMEPRFNADFSGVRVHTDDHAQGLARSVNAQAFTVGRNVVFGSGRFSPNTESGKRLIAHELTHVVQQSAAGPMLARAVDNPFAAPVNVVNAWLYGTVDVTAIETDKLQDQIDELAQYRDRYEGSSLKIEQGIAQLQKELAKRNAATKPKARRGHGKATKGKKDKKDDNVARPEQKPRVLVAKRLADVTYANGKEERAEYNLITTWLTVPDLSTKERKRLQQERDALSLRLQDDRANKKIERHNARVVQALSDTNAHDAKSALVALAHTIETITPDPEREGVSFIHHQSERIAISDANVEMLRNTLNAQLAEGERHVVLEANHAFARYKAVVKENDEHWLVARMAEVVGGHILGIDDPWKALTSRWVDITVRGRELRAFRKAGQYEKAAAILPDIEVLQKEMTVIAKTYQQDYIDGVERSITVLQITKGAAFAIATSIGAALAAPLVAGYVVGLGFSGAGAAAASFVGTTALVGGTSGVVRGTAAFGGALARTGSVSKALDEGVTEGVEGLKDGALAGSGASGARILGSALGVGKNVGYQALRRVGTEVIINGTTSFGGAMLHGKSVTASLETAGLNAALSIPGALLGGAPNSVGRQVGSTLLSGGSAFTAAKIEGASTSEAFVNATIAMSSHLATSRQGHAEDAALVESGRRAGAATRKVAVAAKNSASQALAATMIGVRIALTPPGPNTPTRRAIPELVGATSHDVSEQHPTTPTAANTGQSGSAPTHVPPEFEQGNSSSNPLSSAAVPTTAATTAAAGPRYRAEVIGEFTVSGTREIEGTAIRRRIDGLFAHEGPQLGIGPIRRFMRTLIADAQRSGATRLILNPEAVINNNVLRMRRFIAELNGTVRVIGHRQIEIEIPIPQPTTSRTPTRQHAAGGPPPVPPRSARSGRATIQHAAGGPPVRAATRTPPENSPATSHDEFDGPTRVDGSTRAAALGLPEHSFVLTHDQPTTSGGGSGGSGGGDGGGSGGGGAFDPERTLVDLPRLPAIIYRGSGTLPNGNPDPDRIIIAMQDQPVYITSGTSVTPTSGAHEPAVRTAGDAHTFYGVQEGTSIFGPDGWVIKFREEGSQHPIEGFHQTYTYSVEGEARTARDVNDWLVSRGARVVRNPLDMPPRRPQPLATRRPPNVPDFGPEETDQPTESGPQDPKKPSAGKNVPVPISNQELQHLAAIALRRPVLDLDGVVLRFPTVEAFNAEYQKRFPGRKIQIVSVLDRTTKQILLHPLSKLDTGVHEVTHYTREVENPVTREEIGAFLDEGATEAMVRARDGVDPMRQGYEDNVAFFGLLKSMLRSNAVEMAIVHGDHDTLRRELLALFGGNEIITDTFYDKLRSIGKDVQNRPALDEAIAMLEMAGGYPRWRTLRAGAAPEPIPASRRARIERVGEFSFLGEKDVQGSVITRRIGVATRNGNEVTEADVGPFLEQLLADANAAQATHLVIKAEFMGPSNTRSFKALVQMMGGTIVHIDPEHIVFEFALTPNRQTGENNGGTGGGNAGGSTGASIAPEAATSGAPPAKPPIPTVKYGAGNSRFNHSLKELQHFAAEAARRPVTDLWGKVMQFRNDAEFEAEYRRRWPNETTPPGAGSFDPITRDILLRPSAPLDTAIHEVIHLMRNRVNPRGRRTLGDFLDEGATEVIVRSRKGADPHREVYERNVAFYRLLKRVLGDNVVEMAMMQGQYGDMRAAILKMFGGDQQLTETFYNRLHNIGAQGENIQALDEAVGMIETATGRPSWQWSIPGAALDPLPGSVNTRIETVGRFNFMGVREVQGNRITRRIGLLLRNGLPVQGEDFAPFFESLRADAVAAGATRLRIAPQFVNYSNVPAFRDLVQQMGATIHEVDAKHIEFEFDLSATNAGGAGGGPSSGSGGAGPTAASQTSQPVSQRGTVGPSSTAPQNSGAASPPPGDRQPIAMIHDGNMRLIKVGDLKFGSQTWDQGDTLLWQMSALARKDGPMTNENFDLKPFLAFGKRIDTFLDAAEAQGFKRVLMIGRQMQAASVRRSARPDKGTFWPSLGGEIVSINGKAVTANKMLVDAEGNVISAEDEIANAVKEEREVTMHVEFRFPRPRKGS